MRVQTSALIRKTPSVVFHMLCQSKMSKSSSFGASLLFCIGVPKPLECKLSSVIGGVGVERQCISERGTILQRITLWDEPKQLQFVMEATTIYFRSFIASIEESFDLAVHGNSDTRITRTTTFQVRGRFRFLKFLVIWLGLKIVHRYVFNNFSQN